MRIMMRSPGTPEYVARGVVLGVFVCFTPLLGFHIVMALILATIFRVSRLASLPPVFITNIFTAVPIYSFTHHLGSIFLPKTDHTFIPLLKQVVENLRNRDWFEFREIFSELAKMSTTAFLAMFIGGFIVAAVISVPSWYLTLRAVRGWRHRRAIRLHQKRLRMHAAGHPPPHPPVAG